MGRWGIQAAPWKAVLLLGSREMFLSAQSDPLGPGQDTFAFKPPTLLKFNAELSRLLTTPGPLACRPDALTMPRLLLHAGAPGVSIPPTLLPDVCPTHPLPLITPTSP